MRVEPHSARGREKCEPGLAFDLLRPTQAPKP
jgi:hypothetical protein